ncbi:MAG: beta-lactamase family protein [Cytophagales bacterium]|nr:beta-lactamase family protein [Cytophagales bacterium]
MKKKILYVLAGLVIALSAAFALSPEYLQKALIHQKANIDDYKIFANRKVETGNYIPWKISPSLNSYKIEGKEREDLEALDPVAFLVIQNGEIRYEEYWDGYSDSSLSNSFSMAKSIVSLLTGIAIKENKIKNVDQRASDFIPSYRNETNRSLSIRNLLTMSSGLNWDESYGSPCSITTKAYYGNDINPLIENLKVIQTPGKEYKYLSGNTQVLAMVLEKATGMKVGKYASEKLWKKIGAKNTALWSTDRKGGMEKAYCCFNSNARDFARLGQLVLNKGKWYGKQVVPAHYIKEAISPATYLTRKGKPVDFYGYQFWILNHRGMEIPYYRGILGQYIFAIPEKNAVVVRLGHKRSKEKIGVHPKDVFQYIDLAMKIID